MGIGNIANTGMNAAMSNMEVISNNIANSNTTGFKKSYINFQDIYPSGSGASTIQIGLGVNVSSVLQDFSSGGTLPTGLATDMSINNNGFFVMKDASSGQITYTRAGRFSLDENGYLVSNNSRLQGFMAVNGKVLPGSSVNDLQISQDPLSANASTTVSTAINLDANSVVPTNTFDPTDSTSYNYTTQASVFDSLGNSYPVTLYYVKTAANTWSVKPYINGTSLGTGTLSFSTSGQLTSSTGLNALSFAPTSGATSPQAFALQLTNSTQFANPNGVTTQPATDGYEAGTPTRNFTVDQNGNVLMTYSNGLERTMGQIAIAEFEAPQGLMSVGNMSWVSSTTSGAAILNQGNSQGAISSGSYELSNVDLTSEMVNLIGAQHTFQANAQVEQVYNEVMQTVIQL